MTIDVTRDRLGWLTEAAASGAVHTVRVSWSDRLGVWRGKRLPVDDFLGSPDRRIGFCDGMIVVDVNCDIIQTTPFSNFQTGYPDMYVQPDLRTLRPVGWAPGEAFVLGTLQSHGGTPLAVAPRNVLRGVVARLADRGLRLRTRTTLTGRLMHAPGEPVTLLPGGLGRDETEPGTLRTVAEGLLASGVPVRSVDADADGTFRLGLGPLDPIHAGDSAVVAKAACKEVALARGRNAVFMTRLPDRAAASELHVALDVDGPAAALDPRRLEAALGDVRGLLQPSITAFKAGPAATPRVAQTAGGTGVAGLRAAGEADPLTALAAMGAALGVALDPDAVPSPHGPPRSLALAADRLEATPWVIDWLGEGFVENTVPLLRHEVALFDEAVTDWETTRYWMQG